MFYDLSKVNKLFYTIKYINRKMNENFLLFI